MRIPNNDYMTVTSSSYVNIYFFETPEPIEIKHWKQALLEAYVLGQLCNFFYTLAKWNYWCVKLMNFDISWNEIQGNRNIQIKIEWLNL